MGGTVGGAGVGGRERGAPPRPNPGRVYGDKAADAMAAVDGVSIQKCDKKRLGEGKSHGRKHTFMDSEFRRPDYDPTDEGIFEEGLVFVIMPFS